MVFRQEGETYYIEDRYNHISKKCEFILQV